MMDGFEKECRLASFPQLVKSGAIRENQCIIVEEDHVLDSEYVVKNAVF